MTGRSCSSNNLKVQQFRSKEKLFFTSIWDYEQKNLRNGNEQINPITRTNFRQREKIRTGGGILLVTFQSFESITRLELTAEIIRTIGFFGSYQRSRLRSNESPIVSDLDPVQVWRLLAATVFSNSGNENSSKNTSDCSLVPLLLYRYLFLSFSHSLALSHTNTLTLSL